MKKRQETKHTADDFEALCEALSCLTTAADVNDFLIDLCTPAEIEGLSDRLKIAKLLQQGKPYRSISELTGASVTTVTRVARTIKDGKDGYAKVIK